MTTQSPTERLKALTSRAQAEIDHGRETAQTVRDWRGVSDEVKATLEYDAANDPAVQEELAALEGMRTDIQTDPSARYHWLQQTLADLADDGRYLNPRSVVAVGFACGAHFLKKQEGEEQAKQARRLFTRVPYKDAQRYKTFAVVSNARKHNEGKSDEVFKGFPPMALIPASPADEDNLKLLRDLRRKALQNHVEKLEGETLVDLREAVWTALQLAEHASIYTVEMAEKTFEQKGVQLCHQKNGRLFEAYQLSDDEVFVIRQSPLAARLMKQLRFLDDYAERFWKGEIDSEAEILEAIKHPDNQDRLVTPTDFLEGAVGITAVRHDKWRTRAREDTTTEVVILLQRLEQNLWRWVLCSRDGVEGLFGGKRLAFHQWTKAAVPAHLRNLLELGTSLVEEE